MTPDPVFSTIARFFILGGPFMGVLLTLSVLSLAAILLRVRRLRENAIVPQVIVECVGGLQPGDTLDRLIKEMKAHPSAISRILNTLLAHLNWSKSENLEAVQTCASTPSRGQGMGVGGTPQTNKQTNKHTQT